MAASALKFGKQIRELRIFLCQTSPASKGVRDFIENHYVPLKKANPNFPILIRECSKVTPAAVARYEFGQEKALGLDNLSSEEVLATVKSLNK